MGESDRAHNDYDNNNDAAEGGDEFKLHISRVPTKFDEGIVKRILEGALGEDSVTLVELIYPREDAENEDGNKKESEKNSHEAAAARDFSEGGDAGAKEHRGFGFVSLASAELLEKALEMETIRGGRKPTSKKQSTMYMRPYVIKEEQDEHACYLWSKYRCPYGEECKFAHVGEGGCIVKPSSISPEDEEARMKKKRGKCFEYKKTGKCSKGDDCPFSHDFEPKIKNASSSKKGKKETKDDDNDGDDTKKEIPKSEKDCINWKTKGKCRKLETCPYRHDPALLEKVKQKKLKRQRENMKGKGNQQEDEENKKTRQPLSVRIFGMSYDTTPEDIREFLKDCGPIQDVMFPTFEDSGRSKGYCGVWFSSPKAVEKAIALDGQELMGRWLSIQAGKMYLRQWEELHPKKKDSRSNNNSNHNNYENNNNNDYSANKRSKLSAE